MTKLFFLVMYSDFDKSRIAYAGLFDSKQEHPQENQDFKL